MCVMEMIYHVHLTKTNLENIKHFQLTRACTYCPTDKHKIKVISGDETKPM